MNGYTAYFISCLDLLERLQRSRDQGRLKNKLTWFGKPHVLLIDEVGYENLTGVLSGTPTDPGRQRN
jgi:DNA replication protein DnaC